VNVRVFFSAVAVVAAEEVEAAADETDEVAVAEVSVDEVVVVLDDVPVAEVSLFVTVIETPANLLSRGFVHVRVAVPSPYDMERFCTFAGPFALSGTAEQRTPVE
jgi:hypothetical protein